jgi:hypothetical protein
MGAAYAVPDFCLNKGSSNNKPTTAQRFSFVNRRWTDRSNWVESVPTLTDANGRNVNVSNYIESQGTSWLHAALDADREARRKNHQKKRAKKSNQMRALFDIELNLDSDTDIDDMAVYSDEEEE